MLKIIFSILLLCASVNSVAEESFHCTLYQEEVAKCNIITDKINKLELEMQKTTFDPDVDNTSDVLSTLRKELDSIRGEYVRICTTSLDEWKKDCGDDNLDADNSADNVTYDECVVAYGAGNELCESLSDSPRSLRTLSNNSSIELDEDLIGKKLAEFKTNKGYEDFKDNAEGYANKCSAKLDTSESCCNNPLSCLGDEDNTSAQTVGQYSLTGLQLYQMIKGGGAQSAAESCKLAGQLSKIGAAVQASTAGVCINHRNKCSNECGEYLSKAEDEFDACKKAARLHAGGGSDKQLEDACSKVEDEYLFAKSTKSKCNSLIGKASEQSFGVAQSLIAVNLNKKCQELGEDAPPITDFPDVADCSLTQNLNSPFCRAQACQRPDQVNNPLCAQFNNLLANTNSSQNDTDLGAGGSGSAPSVTGLDGSGFDDEIQGLNIADTAPNENSFSSGGGGGGGGGVTAAASAGGGGGSRGGRGGAAAGSKKDLKGLFGRAKGGKGYQRSFGSRGGYRGRSFGKKGSSNRRSARAKFNLKKYLPGRSLYGKRKLASVKAKDRAGIASRHASIWKIVSDRYQVHCKTKQLQGCR